MMELFESGLFMELGEVVGHDPDLYEDIPKQHKLNTTSSADVIIYHHQMEEKSQFMKIENVNDTFLPADGGSEIDLLAEGNNLLEQLMAANGLDLSSDYIDLADINELDFATKSGDLVGTDTYLFGQHEHDLLSDLHAMAQSSSLDDDYPFADSPLSTISTLASEPSSPLDISAMQHEQQLIALECATNSRQEPDLANLLQSLVDETIGDDNECNVSAFYDTLTGSADANDTSYLSHTSDENDDSVLTYTSLPSPSSGTPVDVFTKVKTKKKKKSTPYNKLPAGRKERKKKQNKEAAIRYREKKRSEAQGVMGEEAQLADKNKELKTEVLNLEREILCMKELLSDVFNIHSL